MHNTLFLLEGTNFSLFFSLEREAAYPSIPQAILSRKSTLEFSYYTSDGVNDYSISDSGWFFEILRVCLTFDEIVNAINET